MGNAFHDNDAFLGVDADCLWVKVTVMVTSSLKAFNGMLQHTTVIWPSVDAVGGGSRVWVWHRDLARWLWINILNTPFLKAFAMTVGLLDGVAAWGMRVDMFFMVPDVVSTIGAEIFGAPIKSCLIMGPVTPKFVSGVWGCQWDLASAVHRWVASVGVSLPSSGCFLW